MNHLVRCRGGEWRIEPWPGSRAWLATNPERKARFIHWNAYPIDITVTSLIWPDTPAWLPVAWLCCEADPAEGPKFAAAILDAGPGDDSEALIATEWLEERGPEGGLRVPDESIGSNWMHEPARSPGWEWSYVPQDHGYYGRGPLASWCRHLIDTRCVACGGRRDGEDQIKVSQGYTHFNRKDLQVYVPAASRTHPDCPLCGFPAHPTPPALAIPEVVK